MRPTCCLEVRRAIYAGFATRELTIGGAAPPIVMIHGFGDSADAWCQVLQLLGEAGQSAVAVDLPGFGAADPLRRGELLPQLDAFVAELISHYGASKPVVVVGNSLGAALAARVARTQDPAIGAVMPIGIAGVSYTALVTRGLVPLVASARWLPGLRVPPRVHRAMVGRVVSRLLYGDPLAADPTVVAAFSETMPDLTSALRLLRLGAKFLNELDRTRHHGGIGIPMTVLHGCHDHLVPVSAGRIVHQANPGSRFIMLAQAGHCPQLDAPHDVVHHARELARAAAKIREIS